MKKILIIGCLLVSLSSMAQDQQMMEKIESARIGLITERLGLSPDQAEKFWPLYKEFSRERNLLRQELRDARGDINPEKATEAENQRLLEMQMKLKERELNLEKQYSERILQVISSRQMIQLRKAETDFRNMILNQLRERQRMNELRQRNNNRINQLRN